MLQYSGCELRTASIELLVKISDILCCWHFEPDVEIMGPFDGAVAAAVNDDVEIVPLDDPGGAEGRNGATEILFEERGSCVDV
ncbi:hypothetical protein CFter6_4082 [Collimonas fungivorans]|uniref:Uncharacterized protein n=1 Tax=Collimonas fungivorans TaxID=158899 RepID=A0A127PH03_9BURK|nr:hypothetical protein CFter6_4082 [Collimonas fungivorans]